MSQPPLHASQWSSPARKLGDTTDAGYILLRETGSAYRDGGEERVLEILRSCQDVSADSDEAYSAARTWPERYHVSPTRANIVRHLELPADGAVLEIGAGCGAVTRYLGETCRVVDALEPVPARASAIAERCRDLENVAVLVGELEDLPLEPFYDVVVVIGVLEYVGLGSADPTPYQDFLRGIAARLRPGGSLVLAIENKLGVKYLSGAPEDHSGRVFDSLESYPFGSPARTFSRPELEALMLSAGLTPTTGIAFPDYKIPRAILRPSELPVQATSLLYRIPSFPSPDWMQQREHLTDERRLWRVLVEAGLALETGNSFLVVAGKDGTSALWPDNRAGTFYSVHRRKRFTVRTDLEVDNNQVRLTRTGPNQPVPSEEAVLLRAESVEYAESSDFLDVFLDTDDPASVALLQQWRRLVHSAEHQDGFPIDLVPHNLVIQADGQARAIDNEWFSTTTGAQQTLERGALLVALHLAQLGRVVAPWRGCHSYRDIAFAVGAAIGLDSSGSWLDETVRREAQFLHLVLLDQWGQSDADRVSSLISDMHLTLSRNIREPLDFEAQLAKLRQAEHDLVEQVETAKEQFTDYEQRIENERHELKVLKVLLDTSHQEKVNLVGEVAMLTEQLQEAQIGRSEAENELAASHASLSWALTKPLRTLRGLIKSKG